MKALRNVLNVLAIVLFLLYLVLTYVSRIRFADTAILLLVGMLLLGSTFFARYFAQPIAKRKETLLIGGLFVSLISIASFVLLLFSRKR